MKFYVATAVSNARQAARMIRVLEAAGHTCTYDWTASVLDNADAEERGLWAHLTDEARKEELAVRDAHMLIVLLPGARGTHTELGISIGSGCKDIILCCEDAGEMARGDVEICPFYLLSQILCVEGEMDDWLAAILSRAREIEARHNYRSYGRAEVNRMEA